MKANTIVRILSFLSAIIVSAFFIALIWNIFSKGFSDFSLSFILDNPTKGGREGGVFPILMSTALIVTVCIAISTSMGLGSAIFLSEFTKHFPKLGNIIRRCLEILAGVPSIVFGLFGSAFFCIYLEMGFSILAGGLTLACMILPLTIRAAEEGLRQVPDSYRINSLALGISKRATVFRILIPAAMPSLVVALVLGIGRALSETAALLFTSGYVLRTPESLLDSGRSLSVHIYDLSMNVPGGESKAYASALTLIIVLFFINTLSSGLTKRWLRN